MITCPVCGGSNNDLAVVCVACRSYLQAKVDTLDLFSTVWGLIESPGTAFRRILLATHKNYVVLLAAMLGIASVYALLWMKNLGSQFENIMSLALPGILYGPFVGILLTLLLALALVAMGRGPGGRLSLKNAFAVIAYASVPIACSLVFVFPAEVALFGVYFFGNNPPPAVINPVAYFILVGLDAAAVLWSFLLLVQAMRVGVGVSLWRAATTVCGVAGVTGGIAAVAWLV